MFALAFIHLGTRRVFVTSGTDSTNSRWMEYQARTFLDHVAEQGLTCEILMRDHDGAYSMDNDLVSREMDISFEHIFTTDILTKRQRVERALNHQSVDRVPIHEQLSYNPGVISLYTGKQFEGYDFTLHDVGDVIRRTLDTCFPLVPNKGTGMETTEDGFVFQNENWMTWRIKRPFKDEKARPSG